MQPKKKEEILKRIVLIVENKLLKKIQKKNNLIGYLQQFSER